MKYFVHVLWLSACTFEELAHFFFDCACGVSPSEPLSATFLFWLCALVGSVRGNPSVRHFCFDCTRSWGPSEGTPQCDILFLSLATSEGGIRLWTRACIIDLTNSQLIHCYQPLITMIRVLKPMAWFGTSVWTKAQTSVLWFLVSTLSAICH